MRRSMPREMAVPAPSEEALRRGRAKFMQRAAELRELKVAPRKRAFPVFQRLAITLTLTAMFLASGTGLVGLLSTTLPGENLYPVKRSWEGLRLIFTFNELNVRASNMNSRMNAWRRSVN